MREIQCLCHVCVCMWARSWCIMLQPCFVRLWVLCEYDRDRVFERETGSQLCILAQMIENAAVHICRASVSAWFVWFKRQSAPFCERRRAKHKSSSKKTIVPRLPEKTKFRDDVQFTNWDAPLNPNLSWTGFDKFGPHIDVGLAQSHIVFMFRLQTFCRTHAIVCALAKQQRQLPACWSWTTFLFYWMLSKLKISPEYNVLHVSSFCSLVIYRNTYTDVIMLRFSFVPISSPSALTCIGCVHKPKMKFNSIKTKKKKQQKNEKTVNEKKKKKKNKTHILVEICNQAKDTWNKFMHAGEPRVS